LGEHLANIKSVRGRCIPRTPPSPSVITSVLIFSLITKKTVTFYSYATLLLQSVG